MQSGAAALRLYKCRFLPTAARHGRHGDRQLLSFAADALPQGHSRVSAPLRKRPDGRLARAKAEINAMKDAAKRRSWWNCTLRRCSVNP